MAFGFLHRSPDDYSRSYVMPLSIVMQVYALGHIAYYKWKYDRQDNQVRIFYLNPDAGRDAEGQQQQPSNNNSNNNPNLNTKAHNKLLFEIKTIVLNAILLIALLLAMTIIDHLQEKNWAGLLPITYCFQDWAGMLLFNVAFPFYFYYCNSEARAYFKTCFSNAK